MEQIDENGFIQTLAEIRVVSILDGVVSAASHLLGDITPSVAMHQVQLNDEHIFLHGPLALADVRVQVVVPSFTTLLPDAAGQALGDVGPVFRARPGDDLSQDLVLFLGPCALCEVTAVVQLEPACVALDLGLAREELADTVPGILTESLDVVLELLVL